MEKFDASAYNISIVRRPVDGHFYFVGTVQEFPHIKVYEDSWAESYKAIQAIIEDLYAEAVELKESFPAPINEIEGYSGRVTLRLPKWLHANLDSQAKAENVSLNTHVISLLSFASANRAYAEVPTSKAPPTSNRVSKSVVVKFRLPSIIHSVAQNLENSVTIAEVHPMTEFLSGGFSSATAVHRTEIKTYRQELRHGQETRH